MNETQRRARGHNFTPPKAVLSKVPKLYETEDSGFEGKTIYLHYFSPDVDWYVAELDPEDNEAFGYVRRSDYLEGAEWGYFNLDDMETKTYELRFGSTGFPRPYVERDCHWTPRKFGDIKEAQ